MSFLCLTSFPHKSAYPEPITCERESGTDEGCDEIEDSGDETSPTASVHHIHSASDLRVLAL